MNSPFLTKNQRKQLIEEYVECAYSVDEAYSSDDEDNDRVSLARLGNAAFCEEITSLMPEALYYLQEK